MSQLWALAIKDIRVLVREKLNFVWILGIPLIFALFFGSIMGGAGPSKARPMRVAVVAEVDGGTRSPAAQGFLERLAKSESIELTSMTKSAAADAVRLGKRVAWLSVEAADKASTNPFFGGVMPKIEVGIDPTRSAEAGMLQGMIMEAAFGGFQEMFSDPKVAREKASETIAEIRANQGIPPAQRLILVAFFRSLETFMTKLDEDETFDVNGGGGPGMTPDVSFVDVARDTRGKPRSAFEISFPSAVLWGLLGVSSAFAIGIVRERKAGTLLRLLTAPISRSSVLGGKALACFVVGCAVIVVLMLFSRFVFGVRITSPVAFVMAATCTSACFVGMTLLLSVLGNTEESVSGISWGLFIVFAMLGGGMVPLIAMPAWMANISNVSPIKWGIVALEGAIWRDFSLAEMLFPCGILLGVGVVGFVAGWRLLARKGL